MKSGPLIACIGVDLAWKAGNWSGVAAAYLDPARGTIEVEGTEWLQEEAKILQWVGTYCRKTTVVAIDAPIFAPNRRRGRQCDRDLSSDFGRYHAGCHPAFLSKCRYPIEFRTSLESLGFDADPSRIAGRRGLRQVEVYPHPWQVVLFRLEKTIKYKKSLMDKRWSELQRLAGLMQQHLSKTKPRLLTNRALQELYDFGDRLHGKEFKKREDRLDAVLCAYAAGYFWLLGEAACRIYYSDPEDYRKGYIVTPIAPGS